MHQLKLILFVFLGCCQITFGQNKFSRKNLYFELGRPTNYCYNYALNSDMDAAKSSWVKTLPDGVLPLYFSMGYSFKKADIVLSTYRDAIMLESAPYLYGGLTVTSDVFHFNTLHFFYHPYTFKLYERGIKIGICSDLTYAKRWGGPFDGSPEYKFWWNDGSITIKELAVRGVDFDLHNNYFFAGLSAKVNYELTSNIGIWAQTGYSQGFRKIGSTTLEIRLEEPNVAPKVFHNTVESQGTRYFFQFGLSLNPFRKIKLKP